MKDSIFIAFSGLRRFINHRHSHFWTHKFKCFYDNCKIFFCFFYFCTENVIPGIVIVISCLLPLSTNQSPYHR